MPDDKVLVPGVIDIDQQLHRAPRACRPAAAQFADIVGPERVIAGTDCGFGTWAGFGPIDPDICWAKLRALADGAAMASRGQGRALARA